MAKILASHSITAGELASSMSIKQNGAVLTTFADSFYEEATNRFQFRRSLARDGFLGLYCIEKAIAQLKNLLPISRTGIYSAALNGPLLYNAIEHSHHSDKTIEMLNLKKQWPPKQHFRQNAPLRATHYSLYLKTQGPLITMVDPVNGLIDALNWAEIDLFDGTVDYAVVVGAFTLEDVQITNWYAEKAKELQESAVCLILSNNKNLKQHQSFSEPGFLSYGFCTPVINQLSCQGLM